MVTIKKNHYDLYEVKMWRTGNVVLQNNLQNAIELCRLRLNKTLAQDNLKVIKVPFIGLWLVW